MKGWENASLSLLDIKMTAHYATDQNEFDDVTYDDQGNITFARFKHTNYSGAKYDVTLNEG